MVELVVHRLAADALSHVPLRLLTWILRFMRNPSVGHRLPMCRLAWCTGGGIGSSLLGAVHHLVYVRIVRPALLPCSDPHWYCQQATFYVMHGIHAFIETWYDVSYLVKCHCLQH